MTTDEGVLGAIARANEKAQAIEKMKADSAMRLKVAAESMAKEPMANPDSGSGWDAKPTNPDSGSGWSAAPATPNSGWSGKPANPDAGSGWGGKPAKPANSGWDAKPANPDSGSGWSAEPNAPGSAANPIRYQPGMPKPPSGTYVIHPDGTLVVVP